MAGRRLIALGAVALAAAGLLAGVLRSRAAPAPAWQEIAWPYPLDPWPAGRAFLCAASRCGSEVTIALRPKIGFCNCATGVADDDEIDRVGDVVVLGSSYTPDGPGWPLHLGGLAGRSRRYLVDRGAGGTLHVLGLAVAAHCDVVVGIVHAPAPLAPEVEAAALRFLSSDAVRPWAENSVGGS